MVHVYYNSLNMIIQSILDVSRETSYFNYSFWSYEYNCFCDDITISGWCTVNLLCSMIAFIANVILSLYSVSDILMFHVKHYDVISIPYDGRTISAWI